MRLNTDDIRKRIEKRKKQQGQMKRKEKTDLPWLEDEERYGFDRLTTFESGPADEEQHPLFRKEWFILKVLTSVCLVLIVAIMFRNGAPALEPAREFVTKSMSEEFQFAAVSDWYESTFGKPLALLPSQNEEQIITGEQHYALPASGRVLEKFGENGQRITIETSKGAAVEAMNGGLVLEIGKKEGFGQTVVIQHPDKSESWYGNLSSIDVTLYQYIEKGTTVGKATDYEDGTKGSFYFAIKEGEDFVDPIQVIQFE